MIIKKRNGMTLIEVIISIVLLGIISISILPVAVYSVKYAKWNNIRLNAQNLAYTQVEWLKTLDYETLGLDISGYSPEGIVNPNHYMNNPDCIVIGNTEYNIYTSIYWYADVSITGEPVPQAMKKIDVTIEALDKPSGKYKEYSVLGTLVTKEGEMDPINPGHVIGTVYLRSFNNPEKNVKVGMGQFKNYSKFTNTNDKGESLFGDLEHGNYKIEPVDWRNPLMVMPNGVELDGHKWKCSKDIIIPKWEKGNSSEIQYPEVSFLIDLPGTININDNDKYPDSIAIEIKPIGESYIPVEGEDINSMVLSTNIRDINSLKFWRLWNYEYKVTKGYERFFLVDSNTDILWDGRFDISDFNKVSKKELLLGFALEEGFYILDKDNPNKIKEIIIEFSSNIINFREIEFQLNGNILPIEDIRLEERKGNKFRISLNPSIDIADENMEFKISNYKNVLNNYNMTLVNEKSIVTLKHKQ